MMNMMRYLLVAVVLCCACVDALNYQKILFTTAESNTYGAKCLDGSVSGFYLSNATSTASKLKWVIFMVGGGFCVANATAVDAVDDCYKRALTTAGSSTKWGNTSGYTPPAFASDWNVVVIPYCGGDLHSGTRKSPIGGLYYSGHNTVVGVVSKLKAQYGLGIATELLVSGGSAGGMGVFINIEYVKNALPGVAVGAFPNAGWFINFPQWNPSVDHRNRSGAGLKMFTAANSFANSACLAALPGQGFYCLLAQYSWQYIQPLRIPFFIANSFFDTNQLGALVANFNGYTFTNPQENLYIVTFGATLRNSTAAANIPLNGLFLTSELVHGVDFTDTIGSTSLQTALSNWYSRTGNFRIIDPCTTPGCQNIPLPP